MMETILHRVDFSSFSQEENIALEKVLQRQKEFEESNYMRRRYLRLELLQLEERLAISESSATDKELCKICFKTKVAKCLRLCCKFCTRKTCSKCGNRELYNTNWKCLLCSKKRHYLSCTGDWYVGDEPLFATAPFFLLKLKEENMKRATERRVEQSRHEHLVNKETTTSTERPMIERLTLSKEGNNHHLIGKDAAFGFHIVGGKTNFSGVMGAFVVAINPGSKAEELLSIGDQITEWNNKSLVDATFEDAHEALSSSPDEVSIVVRHMNKSEQISQLPRPSCIQTASNSIEQRRKSFARERQNCASQEDIMQSILSSSQTNLRKRFDSDKSRISYSSGGHRGSAVKISLWHDPEGLNLIIKILQAQNLSLGTTPDDELPNPYAVVDLLPSRNLSSQFITSIKYQTASPIWNLTFIYSDITEEELSSRPLEVTLWSERKTQRHGFLGKIVVDLVDKVLSNVPQWYYLEGCSVSLDKISLPTNRSHAFSEGDDGKSSRSRYGSQNVLQCQANSTEKNLKLGVPSFNSAPNTPCIKNVDKSLFDYSLPNSDCSDNYATFKRGYSVPSGSSESSQPCYKQRFFGNFGEGEAREDQEILNRDRNKENEHVIQTESEKEDVDISIDDKPVYGVKQKFRQHISLNLRDGSDSEPEKREIMKNVKSRTSPIERSLTSSMQSKMPSDSFSFGEDPQHGTIEPSQIRCHDDQDLGYLRLGLSMTCGVLEVDIIRAILLTSSGTFHPDTYVKTYLIHEEKKLLKRKSSTVRQDANPVYNCKVKYAARDVDNKILNVCIWQNQGVFGRNVPIGAVNILLDRLNMSCRFVAWYKLFPFPKTS